MSEDELIATRTQLALEQWPHLSRAYGCLNCELLFAEPETSALVSDSVGRCPGCRSESVFDVAAALAVERMPVADVVQTVEAIMERIGEEIGYGAIDVREMEEL